MNILRKLRAQTEIKARETAVMKLPRANHVHVAEKLIASLADDDEILAAWAAEAERRADGFDRGEISAVSIEATLVQAIAHQRRRPEYWKVR